MNRRGFLGAILAAGVAPAAIGSGILMPVRLVEPVGIPTLVVQQFGDPYVSRPMYEIVGAVAHDDGLWLYTKDAIHQVSPASVAEYLNWQVSPGGFALAVFPDGAPLLIPESKLGLSTYLERRA